MRAAVVSAADRDHHTQSDGVAWGLIALALVAPFVALLSLTIWRTPFPLTEAVAIFENVATALSSPLWPDPSTSYYRPFFYATVDLIWNGSSSVAHALAWLKVLQIAPAVLLVGVLIWLCRPGSCVEAAAAAVAVVVLIGSPGFRDNLELPLSYTIVGMPLGLLTWALVTREWRRWHAPAIVALTVIATGFKEQGLVLAPLVVVAWWTGAPSARRGVALTVTLFATAYIVMRLVVRDSATMFEQAIGYGFSELSPREAADRFGSFPLWIYAYNALATIGNVLFAEPARGVFRIAQALVELRPQSWHVLHLGSSTALTILIAWRGVGEWRAVPSRGWSPEARLFAATVTAILACGALSFDYSRDRLGGMAVPFYALAAFYALRAAARRLCELPRPQYVVGTLALTLLVAAWGTRMVTTLEYARHTGWLNQQQWLVMLADRRIEFADRETYLQIMESMVEQGTTGAPVRATAYPAWLGQAIGQPF